MRRITSMGLVLLGVSTAVLGALSGVAAFSVVHQRAERSEARAFLPAAEGIPSEGNVDVRSMPYADTSVLRIDVAVDDTVPSKRLLPTGLSRWPGLGEEMVSPAFRQRSAHESALALYAPGHVVGSVSQAGLLSPDELVVYRGVERAQLPTTGTAVAIRGDEPATSLNLPSLQLSNGQVAGLVAVFATCLGLPLIAFLSVAARLSAATRARRLTALRLLGMPARSIRRINAFEVSILAVAGTAAALLAFPLVNAALASSGILGVTWFPNDTSLSWWQAVVVAAVVAGLAVVVASRVDQGQQLASVRSRRVASRRVVSPWRLLPLALGTASLLGQVVTGAQRSSGQSGVVHLDILMLGAVLMTGVGLLIGMAPLIRFSGVLLQRRPKSVAARLGGARAAFDPSATARLVAGVAVLVFAVGVTIGQSRDARAVSVPTGASVDIAVSAQEVSSASRARLLDDPASPAVLQVTPDPQYARTGYELGLITDCESLEETVNLAGDQLGSDFPCQPGSSYWASSATSTDPSSSDLRLPKTLPTLTARELPLPVAAALGGPTVVFAVTRNQLQEIAQSDLPEGTTISQRTATTAVDTALGQMYQIAPYSQPSAFGLDPDSGQHIAMINGYIHLGLLAGALVALMALVIALADRIGERLRGDQELLAGGARASVVRAAHRWEVGVCLSAGLLVSALSGVLGGLAWQFAGGLNHTPDWGAIALLVSAAAALVVLATAASGWLAPRHLDIDALRST